MSAETTSESRETVRAKAAAEAIGKLLKDARAACVGGEKVLSYTKSRAVANQVVLSHLFAEMSRLYERIVALEAKPELTYAGVWRRESCYMPGMFATHDGSLWHCNYTSDQEPGRSDNWTLAVKRGRDGKDLRR